MDQAGLPSGGLRVLIVEDNPDHAEMIKRSFNRSGQWSNIVWAKDGQEALDYLSVCLIKEIPLLPDLILLDIKMPKIDGLEVLHQIKIHPRLKLIPVVMLTTTDREEEVLSSYQSGANGYVTKPMGAKEFFDKMEMIQVFWAQANKTARARC
jgi:Response regulators consisting of a CheY-like receiver domain and a winged-helix DNA-binding domain